MCRVAVEHHRVVLERARLLDGLVQPRELMRRRGDLQLAGTLEPALDAVPRDRGLDGGKVLSAEPLEHRHLVGEPGQTVGQPVGQAGRTESAIAPGCRPAGGASVDEQHVARRVGLPGEQCRPESGESGADDRKIASRLAGQRRRGGRGVRRIKPERGRGRVGECRTNLPRHTRFRRFAVAPTTASSTPNVKISVPITFTCGGNPKRDAPYTHSGKVTVLPALKLVMMESSIDMAKASSATAMTPGEIIA